MTDRPRDDIDIARKIIALATDRLANEPHDTIQGLRRRYYYRGCFVLLERLSARGLAVNVARLRRRGEHVRAEALALAWEHEHDAAPRRKRERRNETMEN